MFTYPVSRLSFSHKPAAPLSRYNTTIHLICSWGWGSTTSGRGGACVQLLFHEEKSYPAHTYRVLSSSPPAGPQTDYNDLCV